MARVQYGTIVTEIKGKVQGQVFQGGNVGFTLRNKGYTKGLSSQARQLANTRLSAQAAAWRSLTDLQRAAWSGIVADWLFYNKFGAAYQGSGYQVYMAYNTILTSFGFSAVEEPGAVDSPSDPGEQTLICESENELLYSRENVGVTYDQANYYACAPYSAGQNSNNKRWIKIGTESEDASSSIDLRPYYENYFKWPEVGQKVAVKVVHYNTQYPYPFYEVVLDAICTPP